MEVFGLAQLKVFLEYIQYDRNECDFVDIQQTMTKASQCVKYFLQIKSTLSYLTQTAYGNRSYNGEPKR